MAWTISRPPRTGRCRVPLQTQAGCSQGPNTLRCPRPCPGRTSRDRQPPHIPNDVHHTERVELLEALARYEIPNTFGASLLESPESRIIRLARLVNFNGRQIARRSRHENFYDGIGAFR